MAIVLVQVAALPNLSPGHRSLTTGTAGGEVVAVKALQTSGTPFVRGHRVTLRLDPISARRFRQFETYIRLQFPFVALMVAATAWAVLTRNFGWASAVFAVSVAVSLLGRILRPKSYPTVGSDGTTIRLNHLDEEASAEWLAANDKASMTVLPQGETVRRRRAFLFGTKPMFFALLAYIVLCMLTAGVVFQPDTRTVPVEREVVSWSAGDPSNDRMKSVPVEGNATLIAECSGGGLMRLTFGISAGASRQLAAVRCDGVPTTMDYTPGKTIAPVIARDHTGVVTDWRITVTQPGSEEQTIPKRLPGWLVALPVILTLALAWVPVEVFVMVRHWRAIPPEQRPYSFDLVPEFSHLNRLGLAQSAIGSLVAIIVTVVVWAMWAQTV